MTDRDLPEEAPRRIAFFISPHGFGHAARAASVMEALAQIEPSYRFDIFTTVPAWFFAKSNSFTFKYHRLLTDIGLVQSPCYRSEVKKASTLQSIPDCNGGGNNKASEVPFGRL